MRRVTNNKRRFNIKDIMSWTFIMLGHYMSFAIYIMALLAIRFYVLEEAAFWPDDIKMHLWVSYTLIIAPAINAVLHITYDEVGSPWTRFAMWIHTLIHMIFIPIMIFVIL